MNELMSGLGMNNGGFLLGTGVADFTKGYVHLYTDPQLDLLAVRAKAMFGCVVRFDTTKPDTLDSTLHTGCQLGILHHICSAQDERANYNCAVCGVDGLNQYCNQCR